VSCWTDCNSRRGSEP